MNTKTLATILPGVLLLITGCTVSRPFAATGGSKSDGTITLSYEKPAFITVNTDPSQGQMLAEQRCKAWGYVSAEEFGGETRNCIEPGGRMCNNWLISKQYQCIGTAK